MTRDGGPAFPSEKTSFDYSGHVVDTKGMSLRDYFAAAALHGFMASKSYSTHFKPEQDAQYVYMIADAMLAERAK